MRERRADAPLRLPVPPGVAEIAERLERAGHETWCVGGGVRDALLGHPQLDWDLATAARPEEVKAIFRRIVPKGIEFGTVGVFDRAGVMHEVTTFRRDVRTDGRHAEVEFGASLDDDLARRDFTINAIAWSPSRAVLHDPFDGRGDLARGLVRAVGDPAARMREDRLRALRAIRFASRFAFEIDDATWRAIADSAPFLTRLSAERVKEELEKTLEQVRRPSVALERWRASGALRVLVPALADVPPAQLAAADCLPQPGLARRPQRLSNRLAAIWLGLPRAKVEHALRALRFANHQVRWAADLAERWEALAPVMRAALAAGAPDDATVRRWAARTGRTLLAPLLRLAAARWAAERELDAGEGGPPPSAADVRSLYRRAVRIAYRDPIELADLAVSGADLLEAGIAPGPELGRLLQRLLDAVVADPARNTREQLLALARGDRPPAAGRDAGRP